MRRRSKAETEMNEITVQPQYEYAEVEFREVTIKERTALIEEAYQWKLKIKRIEEENEPKLRVQCPSRGRQ